MNTKKVAITIPKDLVMMIDMISKQHGISRSKYISRALREKLAHERDRSIREAYDRIFSDSKIGKEQLKTAKWFEGTGRTEGQEW